MCWMLPGLETILARQMNSTEPGNTDVGGPLESIPAEPRDEIVEIAVSQFEGGGGGSVKPLDDVKVELRRQGGDWEG